MAEEKMSAWLKEKTEIEVAGQKFSIRGLSLRETLKLADILGKIMVKCLGIADDTGELKEDVIHQLLSEGVAEIDRIEEVLCAIIGQPKGSLQDQDPVFFSEILRAVLENTDLKAVKENFTKMAKRLNLSPESFGPVSAMLPK